MIIHKIHLYTDYDSIIPSFTDIMSKINSTKHVSIMRDIHLKSAREFNINDLLFDMTNALRFSTFQNKDTLTKFPLYVACDCFGHIVKMHAGVLNSFQLDQFLKVTREEFTFILISLLDTKLKSIIIDYYYKTFGSYSMSSHIRMINNINFNDSMEENLNLLWQIFSMYEY